jgi:mannose-6-phosphate isomerase-like protein (cupin superfamily)
VLAADTLCARSNALVRSQQSNRGQYRARRRWCAATGNLAVPIFAHGSLEAEFYTPSGSDRQKPHSRDEIYVVAQGEGLFFDGSATHRVRPSTFIFVPAGQEHRFEEFSNDFAVWVFFYGPDGGEADHAA